MAAGRLCIGQSLPAPQAAGAAGGVVSLETGKRPPKTINRATKHAFSTAIPGKILTTGLHILIAQKSTSCVEAPQVVAEKLGCVGEIR
jgi:hypothetical protein